MFSENLKLANLIFKKIGGGDYVFTDAAILGGAYISTENPFDCYIVLNGASNVSGNRWGGGDEYGLMVLDKHDTIEINVHMEANQMLLIDIKADGIDTASHLVYDEVDITTPSEHGAVEYKQADGVYRLLTSKSDGVAAMSKIALRVKDIVANQHAPQQDWTIFFIKVWKVTVS